MYAFFHVSNIWHVTSRICNLCSDLRVKWNMTVVHYFRHSTCFSSLYFQLTLHFKFPWLYENSNLIAVSEEFKISFSLKMKIYNKFIRWEVPQLFTIFNTSIIIKWLSEGKENYYLGILPPCVLLGQSKLRAILESYQETYLANHMKEGSWAYHYTKVKRTT